MLKKPIKKELLAEKCKKCCKYNCTCRDICGRCLRIDCTCPCKICNKCLMKICKCTYYLCCRCRDLGCCHGKSMCRVCQDKDCLCHKKHCSDCDPCRLCHQSECICKRCSRCYNKPCCCKSKEEPCNDAPKLHPLERVHMHEDMQCKGLVTHHLPVSKVSDNFMFGQTSFGCTGEFFAFDSCRGAFRTGCVTGDQWSNSANRGACSFAAGLDTIASGAYAFAEGQSSTAGGTGSHAEGCSGQALGACSHVEGGPYTEPLRNVTRKPVAAGMNSHAEGGGTTALGTNSHAEGGGEYSYFLGGVSAFTTAEGLNSHAEGGATTAIGDHSHSEGNDTRAEGYASHSEGGKTYAKGLRSHAEGFCTYSFGNNSHAEGQETKAHGLESHAEGKLTTAHGWRSHAEGLETTAYGLQAHSEGEKTTASGENSHAGGKSSYAKLDGTFVHGEGVVIDNGPTYAAAFGRFGSSSLSSIVTQPTANAAMYFMSGTAMAPQIGMSILGDTTGLTVLYITGNIGLGGADFAEYYEWFTDPGTKLYHRLVDISPDDCSKIVLAQPDTPFIGITSNTPSVITKAPTSWPSKFLTDPLGSIVQEDDYVTPYHNAIKVVNRDTTLNQLIVDVIRAVYGITKTASDLEPYRVAIKACFPTPISPELDAVLNMTVIPTKTSKLNPEYNKDLVYKSRENRTEWIPVGVKGQVILEVDETCDEGGYAKAGVDGVGTWADRMDWPVVRLTTIFRYQDKLYSRAII